MAETEETLKKQTTDDYLEGNFLQTSYQKKLAQLFSDNGQSVEALPHEQLAGIGTLKLQKLYTAVEYKTHSRMHKPSSASRHRIVVQDPKQCVLMY